MTVRLAYKSRRSWYVTALPQQLKYLRLNGGLNKTFWHTLKARNGLATFYLPGLLTDFALSLWLVRWGLLILLRWLSPFYAKDCSRSFFLLSRTWKCGSIFHILFVQAPRLTDVTPDTVSALLRRYLWELKPLIWVTSLLTELHFKLLLLFQEASWKRAGSLPGYNGCH